MRWLYHLLPRAEATGASYAPASLATEGFVHCSFRDEVAESARLYFPAGAPLDVLQIDPRRLEARVVLARTPRGPMPHVHGPIPAAAIARRFEVERIDAAPDLIGGI